MSILKKLIDVMPAHESDGLTFEEINSKLTNFSANKVHQAIDYLFEKMKIESLSIFEHPKKYRFVKYVNLEGIE